jgi:hemerythrin-like domain-containing protein
MPVKIGAQAESFSNPLGLLTDCHRRIEMFLRALIAVADQARDGGLNPEQRDALERALTYFREAAPKHTADEEQSLFPRMRRLDHPDVRAALAQVESLEREHRVADELHAKVDKLGWQWLATGSLLPAEIAALQTALAELKKIYDRHIAIEDEQVFPLAKKMLAPEEQKVVGEEMAARRGARTCEP